MTATATATDPQLRSWRGIPLEMRRAERRELLVDAALDLLGTQGGGAFTVRGVCQGARLNARYFYESFDGLDALFVAVFDMLVGQALQQALQALDEAGPDPTARALGVVESVVRYVTEDPRRARVLFVEGLGNEEVGRRRRDTLVATAELVERYVWRQTGMGHDRMGMVASLVLVGGFTELVVTWLDGHLEMSLEDLMHDAAALMVAIGAGAVGVARGRRPGVAPARN